MGTVVFETSSNFRDTPGTAVDISSDGTTVVFGSRPPTDVGRVKIYVYRCSPTTRKYEQVIPVFDEELFPGNSTSPGDHYFCDKDDKSPCQFTGYSVVLSGDGKMLGFYTNTDSPEYSSFVVYNLGDGPPMKPPTLAPSMFPTKKPLPPLNYFTIIDAKTDSTIGSLIPGRPNSIDYSLLDTSSVSIGSIFTSTNSSVMQSVQFTLDNPNCTVCQKRVPYTLFGDKQGNVIGAPFTLGRRHITATAYDGTNCNGRRVGVLSQSFVVNGCNNIQYKLYDAESDEFVMNLMNTTTIAHPPCAVSIGVTFQCGFQPDTVVFKLWNTTTTGNSSSSSSVPMLMRTKKKAPHFLFGDNSRGNIYPGRIIDGNYALTIEIDGVIHPTTQFTYLSGCAGV